VERAQKEGYQIDSMTSYAVNYAGSSGRTVNLLVAMSKESSPTLDFSP
jgi:hypothetical protein